MINFINTVKNSFRRISSNNVVELSLLQEETLHSTELRCSCKMCVRLTEEQARAVANRENMSEYIRGCINTGLNEELVKRFNLSINRDKKVLKDENRISVVIDGEVCQRLEGFIKEYKCKYYSVAIRFFIQANINKQNIINRE